MAILDQYIKEQKKEVKQENKRYFIGIFNKILMFPFILVLGSWNEVLLFESPGYIWFIILGISPILAIAIINRTIKKHDFFEWDKKERRKKKEFLKTIIFGITLLTYISVFLLTFAAYDSYTILIQDLNRPELIILILRFIYGILFLLNALFIVYLHYSSFREYLEYAHWEVAKKPENWDWERTSQDDMRDFMQ
jgi:amino acid transporter